MRCRKIIHIFLSISFVGGISDSSVWSNTELAARVQERTAGIPGPRHLAGTEIKTHHVFVGNKIFPLKHLIKPYSKKELNDKRRVFNYRLSRTRRTIENTLGILCARWQIINKGMKFSPCNVEVVKALVCIITSWQWKKDTSATLLYAKAYWQRGCKPWDNGGRVAWYINRNTVWKHSENGTQFWNSCCQSTERYCLRIFRNKCWV